MSRKRFTPEQIIAMLREAEIRLSQGQTVGRHMQRQRHQLLIRFLNEIERQVSDGKVIHVILDNFAAHKHNKVRE